MKYITKNKTLRLYIPMVISLFTCEIIFKIGTKMPIFDWSLLRIFIGVNIFALIISLILSFIKNEKASTAIMIFISLILNIVYIVQAGFYNYLGTVMSLGTSSQAGAVKDFIGDFLGSLKPIFYLVFIPTIILALYYTLIETRINKKELTRYNEELDSIKGKKKKETYQEEYNTKNLKINKITKISCLIATIALMQLYYLTIIIPFMQNDLQMVSNKALFSNLSMPNLAIGQYGVLGFEYIDIKTLLIGHSEFSEEFIKKEPEKITDKSRVIDDTAWEELQNNETNKDYKTLNSYFMSKEITAKNDKTGIFEGKN